MTRPDTAGPNWVEPDEWESPEEPGQPPIDAPEADAMEQSRPLRPGDSTTTPRIHPEVNEADAVEQSRIVEEDDEYRD